MAKGKKKEKKEEQKTDGAPQKSQFLKYLRELSVVVIGVAITFIASGLINRYNEKKNLNRYLEAVKVELEDNLILIREKGKFYERTGQLAQYLISDKPENLSQDSIDHINFFENNSVIGYFFTLVYRNSAFEMLKTSESMSLIGSQKLSRSILESYAFLERTKHDSDQYMERKLDEIYRAILDNEQIFYGEILNPRFRRVYIFFATYIDLDKVFLECQKQIEETLALLADL